MRLSIVIPAYNEQDNVPELYRRLKAALAGLGDELEVLFVDDGSTDGTARAVEALHAVDPRVGLVQLSRNFGHQAALMAGLDAARGDAVIAMDADLQHPPELLPTLIERWRQGAQVVQTVREDDPRASGWFKRWTSRLFYRLLQRMTNVAIVPGAADFFLLDRQAVDALNRCRESSRFMRGLVPWVGFRRELVPYVCGVRFAGRSKYSLARMVRFALDGIFAFSVTPLRLAGATGLVATFLGLCYLLVAAGIHVFGQGTVPGWTSLLAVVVLMGGMQLITLWVIGEYIARIAEQTRQRPPYLVSRSLEPNRNPNAKPLT